MTYRGKVIEFNSSTGYGKVQLGCNFSESKTFPSTCFYCDSLPRFPIIGEIVTVELDEYRQVRSVRSRKCANGHDTVNGCEHVEPELHRNHRRDLGKP